MNRQINLAREIGRAFLGVAAPGRVDARFCTGTWSFPLGEWGRFNMDKTLLLAKSGTLRWTLSVSSSHYKIRAS